MQDNLSKYLNMTIPGISRHHGLYRLAKPEKICMVFNIWS